MTSLRAYPPLDPDGYEEPDLFDLVHEDDPLHAQFEDMSWRDAQRIASALATETARLSEGLAAEPTTRNENTLRHADSLLDRVEKHLEWCEEQVRARAGEAA